MPSKRRKKDNMRFVHNDATPRSLSVVKVDNAPVEHVKDAGTIKAQLVGKLGSRGYGDLLAELREQAA